MEDEEGEERGVERESGVEEATSSELEFDAKDGRIVCKELALRVNTGQPSGKAFLT